MFGRREESGGTDPFVKIDFIVRVYGLHNTSLFIFDPDVYSHKHSRARYSYDWICRITFIARRTAAGISTRPSDNVIS